jgi:hypothetical protein
VQPAFLTFFERFTPTEPEVALFIGFSSTYTKTVDYSMGFGGKRGMLTFQFTV